MATEAEFKKALTRKIGPLPAWAWAITGGAGIYFYRKYKASTTTSAVTSTTTGTAPDASTTVSPDIPLPGTLPGGSDGSGSGGGSDGTNGGPGTDTGSTPSSSGGGGGGLADAINALAATLQAAETNQPTPQTQTSTATVPSLKTGGSFGMVIGQKLKNGDLILRAGHTRPQAPPGYHVVGKGNGNWVAVAGNAKDRHRQKPKSNKPPARKPPARKPPARKPPARKPPARKPPARKPPARKPPARKPKPKGRKR